jgi:hypothetical protein
MSGDWRVSTTSKRELSNFFFLQGKASKEIHAILTKTLGVRAPSYVTVKNGVAQFKRGDFSTCVVPRPRRSKRDYFSNSRANLLAKSIVEQLGISREWV